MPTNNVLTNSAYPANLKPEDVPARYPNYASTSNYSTDRGVLILPIAGPDGTPPAIIKVHSQTGFRVDNFEATKFGAPPVVPAPCNTPSGDILLSSTVEFTLPVISPDQDNLMFRAEGTYLYVQSTLRATGGSSLYQTNSYPYKMDLVDLGLQGIIGGVVGAVTGNNPLHPFFFTYADEYPAYFFSKDMVK